MKKTLPYSLPILLTLIFVLSMYYQFYWVGLILLPFASVLGKLMGKFSLPALLDTYHFFHYDSRMQIFKRCSGLFFILFQCWIVYVLYAHNYSIIALYIIIYAVIIIQSNFAITLAHDLMHSNHWLDKLIARILLLSNGFFYLESDHLFTHHKYVGTDKDPASALPYESLYAYLWRSIPHRISFAIGRIRHFPRDNYKFSLKSLCINFIICVTLLVTAAIISKQVFLYLGTQFICVTLIYEVITYIQHYGLRRTGKDVSVNDAWNCYYKISSYLYYMMPVHSIHHLKEAPAKDEISDPGPSFPLPFAQMFLIAFIPPLWFKKMNVLTEHVHAIKTSNA